MRAKTVPLEPMQKAFVSVPNDWLGQVTREVTNRRGIIEDMPSEGDVTTVVGVLPIAETFGFSNDIRAAQWAVRFGTPRTLDLKCSHHNFSTRSSVKFEPVRD